MRMLRHALCILPVLAVLGGTGADAASLVPVGLSPSALTSSGPTLGVAPATVGSNLVIGGGAGGTTVFGDFNIHVDITFDNTTTAQQQAQITQIFADAVDFWEARVLGYRTQQLADLMARPEATGGGLYIDADLSFIDGAGGILGSAGATSFWNTVYDTPNAGEMTFDSADVANLLNNGTFDDVVLHEMAHVMGFSNFFWQRNGAVSSSTDTTYTGEHGLATYRAEFDANANFVPVEGLINGQVRPGTSYSHWDEQDFANHLAQNGNSQNPELMTGFLDSNNPYVSQTTIASFADIGYAVDLEIVPLPPAGFLLLSALGAIVYVGRRRQAA